MTEHLFPLKDRKEVAEGTMAFWFDTSGSDFTFEAGQNADFTLIDPPKTDAEGNVRTFSFASSPGHRDSFMIATRMRKTAFKDSLKSVPLGTKLKVEGPNGNMVLHEDSSKPAVLFAAGIGITPFRGMLEWATEKKLAHRFVLFYSNRTPALTPFLDELETWRERNPNIQLVPTITDSTDPAWRYESGRINEAMLVRYVGDLKEPIHYLAGPSGMVDSLKTLLLDRGVSRDNVRFETFTGY
jgi:ferredoxin-NADP reductase